MRRAATYFLTALPGLAIALAAHAAPQSPNLTKVETATFLGSEGTEWFTAGAFPGDDSILITGVTLEADLTLHGVKATVLGKDAAPLPAPKKFERLGVKDTGLIDPPDVGVHADLGDDLGMDLDIEEPPTKEEIEKEEKANIASLRSVPRRWQYSIDQSVEAKDNYARFGGYEPSATGFIARFDATLNEVRALYRLPRGAGSIADVAIAKDGAVYIAGGATERIANVTANRRLDEPEGLPPATKKSFPFGHVYIAKLSPDLGKVQWLREVKVESFVPKLRVLANGDVVMLGPGYLRYDPAGKLLQATHMPKDRVASGSAVCPVTGHYTRVGDWMSPTGREPWRCPRLIVYEPDGDTHKWLQGWRGPFFAPHHFHLVADSAVRRSAYDSEGNLYYSTWSHGGNNCMGRHPYDPFRHVPNAMGTVGSQTYCFVVKLGPEHNVKTATLWTSAGAINTLDVAADFSVVWEGRGSDTPSLPNTLARSNGNQIVVTEPNLGSYRFHSTLPGVGTRVVTGGCDEMISTFAFASGTVDGRKKLIVLSGAVAEEPTLDGTVSPPLKNPVQNKFAGGLIDGYALLMDLTPKQPLVFDPPEKKKREKPSKPKPYKGPKRAYATEGQIFKIGTENCTTVNVAFRDENDELWPSFFHGRGVKGGAYTYSETDASADFTLDCPVILQTAGLQHQRVLGELVTAAQNAPDPKTAKQLLPKLKIHVTEMSPWKPTGAYDRFGFQSATCTIGGTLELNGKAIPFKDARCKATFTHPYKDEHVTFHEARSAMPVAHFSVPGKALGLKPPLADQQIRVRVAWESLATDADKTVVDPTENLPTIENQKKPPSLEEDFDF